MLTKRFKVIRVPPLVTRESREKTRILMELPNKRAKEMSRMLLNQIIPEVGQGVKQKRNHAKNLTRRSSGPSGRDFE